MKEIKCRRCGKIVEVEDGYELKTCLICHELDLKDSAIRSANTEKDRDAETLIKRLGIEKIPFYLENYSNFCSWFEERGMPKPTMEIYFKELTNYRRMEIQRQTDEQTSQIKGKNTERRKYNMRFLNFDLQGFSVRERCKIYRLSIMEGKKDNRLDSHLEQCSECQSWQLSFDNGTLNAQYSSDIWNQEANIEPEQKPYVDFDERYAEQHPNMKTLEEGKTALALMNELDNRTNQQPQQTQDPYQEKINKEFTEDEKETAKLNSLPQDKLRRYLEQQDNE